MKQRDLPQYVTRTRTTRAEVRAPAPQRSGRRLLEAQRAGVCRRCSCTDEDCRQCIEKTGRPCYWVKPDLCSACADFCEGFF